MQKVNKITVITASYNAEKNIEKAINSVISQQYEGLEYIIIDGGSKDNTVNIIKKYGNNINYWISEPDKGIYDAWNKGIAKATGDWIMFLGCDDELLPNALADYSKFIDSLDEGVEYVSSKNQMVDENMKPIRIKGWKWEWPKFLNGITVSHPGSLHARSLFKKYGVYNIDYKIAGDYELLLRPRNQLKAAFMDKVTVVMSEGGVSDSVAGIKEGILASIKTGGYSKVKAILNGLIIYFKFKVKYAFRSLGMNVYLRK